MHLRSGQGELIASLALLAVIGILLVGITSYYESPAGELLRPLSETSQKETTTGTTQTPIQSCTQEICDGKDNDCDGLVDEDNVCNQTQNYSFVPGELIIKFTEKSNIKTESQALTYVKNIHGKVASISQYTPQDAKRVIKRDILNDKFGLSRIYEIKVTENSDILELVKEYEKDPNVEYAEPNFIASYLDIPNDPNYTQQWAHQNIESEKAWNIEKGDSNVVIAIIDSGADYNHEDLFQNIFVKHGEDINQNGIVDKSDFNGIDDDGNGFVDDIRGYDFVNLPRSYECPQDDDCYDEDNDPYDTSYDGHGTHVSGIAAAVTNNNKGVAGVCHYCKILPIRAGEKYGIFLSFILEGIVYSADNGAHIISMSFAGVESQSEKNALDYAYDKGLVLVAAAGNSNNIYKLYPAGHDNVIGVSATDPVDIRYWRSQFGSWIDVAAPGQSILSTLQNNTYAPMTGTSMAAPHVAGLAGLLLSKNANLSNEEVRNIIRTAVDVLPEWNNYFAYIGTGRINAFKALQINSIPIANLDSSLDDVIFSGAGIINITGTAAGKNFTNYSVEYGQNFYPTSWKTLKNSTKISVINSTLATFDTSSVPDGYYTIKLTSENSNHQVSIDKTLITIENNYITYPRHNDIFYIRSDDVLININATFGINFTDFKVEYASQSNPNVWSSEGITKFNVKPPVNNTVVAIWNTSYIYTKERSDFYILRITLYTDWGAEELWGVIVYIDIDTTWKKGWPKKIGYEVHPTSKITIQDLDKDGKDDFIIESRSNLSLNWNIHTFKYNGSHLPGWPVVNKDLRGFEPPLSSSGDIDNDGDIEVVSCKGDSEGTNNRTLLIFGFDHKGDSLQTFPLYVDFDEVIDFEVMCESNPLLIDLDMDGDLEILVGIATHEKYNNGSSGNFAKFYAYHHNGSIVNGWPFVVESNNTIRMPSLAGADMDNDGEIEIIVAFSEYGTEKLGRVYMLSIGGEIEPENWPYNMNDTNGHGGAIIGPPVLADFNNDGYIEIAFGSFGKCRISFCDGLSFVSYYILNYLGYNLPKWPIVYYNVNSSSTLALGDLDGDKIPEIIVSFAGDIWVWNVNGSNMKGWPTLRLNSFISPIIGDVEGDRIPEIIFLSDDKVFALYANGTTVKGWPKVIDDYLVPSPQPALGDLDGDGKTDLVVSSSNALVYVWGTNGKFNPSTIHWPQFQHDAQHTGLYTKPYICGDATGDGKILLSDIIYLINFLFKGGKAPQPYEAGDANGDGKVLLSDVIYIINFIFKNGPKPTCGAQLTTTSESTSLQLVQTSSSNINLNGNLQIPAAGLQLELLYDPLKLTVFNVTNTSRTSGLNIVVDKSTAGRIKIGVYDLSGSKTIPSGSGTLLTIRFSGNPATANLRITSPVSVSQKALEMRMSVSNKFLTTII